jgi:hypothetical protein
VVVVVVIVAFGERDMWLAEFFAFVFVGAGWYWIDECFDRQQQPTTTLSTEKSISMLRSTMMVTPWSANYLGPMLTAEIQTTRNTYLTCARYSSW